MFEHEKAKFLEGITKIAYPAHLLHSSHSGKFEGGERVNWNVAGFHHHAKGLGIKSQRIPIKKFSRYLKNQDVKADEPRDSPEFKARAMKASLRHPILVSKHPEGLNVVDGLHRLYKAENLGKSHIHAIVVPRKLIPQRLKAPRQ